MTKKETSEPKVYEAEITDFTQDPTNANKGTERGQYMIDASVSETGLHRGIFVDKNGIIPGGNKTQQAAVDAGYKKAVVVETTGDTLVVTKRLDMDLKDDDPNNIARKAAYYDNRVPQVSIDFDPEQVLADIQSGIDLDSVFQQDEIDNLLRELSTDPPEDKPPRINEAEKLKAEWGTELGQVWELGEHRLVIGDCTGIDDCKKVMDGSIAEVLFTSPPYGDLRDYDNSDLSVSRLKKFISNFSDMAKFICVNLGLVFRDGEIIPYWDEYTKEAIKAGLKMLAWNVWDKGEAGSIAHATNMFALSHEWIFVFGKSRKRLHRHIPNNMEAYKRAEGENVLTTGMRKKVRKKDNTILETTSKTYTHHQLHSVVNVSPRKSRFGVQMDHPAVMSIDLASEYIKAFTQSNEIVIDPFMGSGTTLIACEQLGRRCYGVEISPAYAAITLQRWQDVTGKTPTKKDN